MFFCCDYYNKFMSRATHPLQCNAMMNKKTNKPDSRGNKYEENHKKFTQTCTDIGAQT